MIDMTLSLGEIGAIKYLVGNGIMLNRLTLEEFKIAERWFVIEQFYNFVPKALRLGIGPDFIMPQIQAINTLLYQDSIGNVVTHESVKETLRALFVNSDDLDDLAYQIKLFLNMSE